MKITSIILFVLILSAGATFSQSVEERRTYHDPLSRSVLHENYTVIAGTNTLHGRYRQFARNGTLVRDVNYNNGKAHGVLKDYDPYSGQLIYQATFNNDVMTEDAEFYKDSGTKLYHKVMGGKWTSWHRNGKVAMEALIYPGNQWEQGEMKALDLDIFYLNSPHGPLVKIKQVKFYYESGPLANENYFDTEGVSIRNISYYENGDKKSQWTKLPNSNTYEEILYYETGSRKAVSTEFLVKRKENTGHFVHLTTVNHGKQKRWDEEGNQVSEGEYSNGIPVGQWKKYYDEKWSEIYMPHEASYYRIITYNQDGKPEGEVRDYYITGELQSKFTLIGENPDRYDGPLTAYFKSGQIRTQQNYYRGVGHGIVTFFSEGGLKLKEDSVFNGELKGRKLWREDGTLSSVVIGKVFTQRPDQYGPDLEFQGELREIYHPNGKLESKGVYNIGTQKKSGEWLYYDVEGKIIKKEFYDYYGRLSTDN